MWQFYASKGKHIITSKIEHKAILDTCRELESEGFEITYLEPQPKTGLITPEMVEAAIRPDTILVSLMMVNNEIGTTTDVAAIGEITRAKRFSKSCGLHGGGHERGMRSGTLAHQIVGMGEAFELRQIQSEQARLCTS